MNKICVYTCITGDYDTLKEIKFLDKEIDYICFTNNHLITSNTWKIVYIENEGLDNIALSRKIKIIGNDILCNYETLIWIDGALKLEKSIMSFLNNYCDLKKYDFILIKHHERSCAYDEINECVKLGKENVFNAKKIENYLIENNYPKSNGLCETGILIKKNCDSVKKIMNFWFNLLCNYSFRDQLSINYCLWKFKIKSNIIDFNIFDNKYITFVNHNINSYLVLNLFNKDNFDFHNLFFENTNDCFNFSVNYLIPFDCNKIQIYFYNIKFGILKKLDINNKKIKYINFQKCANDIYFNSKSIIEIQNKFKRFFVK